MEVEIKIDPNLKEKKVLILAPKMDSEVSELMQRLSTESKANLLGFQGDKVRVLQPDEVLRLYSENEKIFAQTETELFQLRLRLYELEESLKNYGFVRVSNSEIVNFRKVHNLDLSFTGTICVIFANGARAFVSRRYLPKIKSYLGL